MFTGIIQEIGKLKNKISTPEGLRLTIQCSTSFSHELKTGDSVAIDGVCQTVICYSGSDFSVDCVQTTLDKTSLGSHSVNDEVNLEMALRPSDRLGGHIVQGHVNDTALITKMSSQGNNHIISLKLNNKDLNKYIVQEGSITIDGISLTISKVDQNSGFNVSVIPHTFDHTTLKNRKIGHKVNIEVDILIKYIEGLLFNKNKSDQEHCPTSTPHQSNISLQWLLEKGY